MIDMQRSIRFLEIGAGFFIIKYVINEQNARERILENGGI